MIFEQAILLAYGITLLSETAIILIIQRPQKMWQWVLAIILVNSLTHPLAIYFLHVQNTPYILVELGVLVLEAMWYKTAFQLNWKRSFALSATANILSILIGTGVRLLINV